MARRRMLYLPLMIAAAVLVACAVASLLAVSQKADAAFPGKNGKIAYWRNDTRNIYTISPGGGG